MFSLLQSQKQRLTRLCSAYSTSYLFSFAAFTSSGFIPGLWDFIFVKILGLLINFINDYNLLKTETTSEISSYLTSSKKKKSFWLELLSALKNVSFY